MKDKLFNLDKEYRWWLIIATFIFLVWLLIVHILFVNDSDRRELYLESELEIFGSKVESTLKSYELFANYIFDEIVNREEVLDLIKSSNTDDEALKDYLRGELYSLFKSKYWRIENYNFRQLQFHLPNGNSFLRMHTPEIFGDELVEIRKSIELVSNEHIYLHGFEQGRTHNGYRFIYPLFSEDKYIGSAELSLSLSTLVNVMYDLYPEMDTFFIIDKAVLEEGIVDQELSNYRTSEFSKDYYSDNEVESKSIKNTNLFTIDERDEFIKLIEPKIKNNFHKNENFTIVTEFNNEKYFVGFLEEKNIEGVHYGYLITIHKDDYFQRNYGHIYIELTLITVVTILFLGASFFFVKNQVNIKKISELDFLTQIFSRYKFLEMANLEMERFKRNGVKFSIIIFDIDYFKRVNDAYGHSKGDEVLKVISKIILSKLRVNDVFARWGGEEFIIMIPETDLEGAKFVAEKIRLLIENHKFLGIGHISISLGIAEVEEDDLNIDVIIDRADRGLYLAKENGRNRVEIYKKN